MREVQMQICYDNVIFQGSKRKLSALKDKQEKKNI